MAATTRDDEEMISGINVTPLVDIALVLLIVFLVTARFITTPALAAVVPQAAHATSVDSPFSLEVRADGRVLMGGVPARDDAEIVARARAAHARDPEMKALLQVDGSVPHARVIRAMDLLKEAGVTHVAFAVAPAGSPPPLVNAPGL
jgi:biopolymer transport protein ExbD